MTNSGSSGYSPAFIMPVIAPPPQGFSGPFQQYYAALGLVVTATETGDVIRQGLEIKIAKAALTAAVDGTLFAMTGGFVQYFPSGLILPTPDQQVSPAGGALELRVWIKDVDSQLKGFPAGVTPIASILYLGVQAPSVLAALQIEVAKMKEPPLRQSWKQANGGTAAPANMTVAALAADHLNRVMLGQAAVFVDGGTVLGQAALADDADPGQGVKFELQFLDAANPGAYISPAFAISGAPFYAP